MKQFIFKCTNNIVIILILLLLGSTTLFILFSADIQPALLYNENNETGSIGPDPISEPIAAQIVNSQDITDTKVYLPIVYGPVPPNPKKGVGVTRPPACDDLNKLKASWYFKWSPFPDNSCDVDEAGKFVPRISDADDMAYLSQAIENAAASGWLIGFTEPNLPQHANLTPRQGAQLWRQIEQQAIPAGIKLVSPAPSQHNPAWLRDMVYEYQSLYGGAKPHFDAVGFNVFYSDPEAIKTYLRDRHDDMIGMGYNVPMWVLEYGGECWTGNPGNDAVVREVTPWLDDRSWIGRYAWYANRLTSANLGWQSCSLINVSTGELTSLGAQYSLY